MDRVPVVWLAAFLHRRGDLHPGLDGMTRGEEGIRAQRALQRERLAAGAPPGGIGYQRERQVALTIAVAGRELAIGGRIDGCDLDVNPVLVEEFKTTRGNPQRAHAQNRDLHRAQALLYAGLLLREGIGKDGFLLRLCYCHPDTLAVTAFEETLAAAAVETFLAETLAMLAAWMERQHAHEQARDARLVTLLFPYGAFRPYQRAMARRVYQALREREGLLLEAPTGSGKTAAVLYPAMRALGAAGYRRVFFLTSRTTGARAAQDALERMDPDATWLRHIQISARDKVCQQAGGACERHTCPLAIGYYDRVRAAVPELLERRAMTPAAIDEIARTHAVCPHELALDAGLWSDVVIGDYNYLFDPVVRLQRFAGESDAAVLIDEAHQLAPRVRDMLSLSLARSDARAALAEGPPAALVRRVRGIDRQLLALERACARPAGQEHEPTVAVPDRREWRVERPAALVRALERFCAAVYEAGTALDSWPATLVLFFSAARWIRDTAAEDSGFRIYRVSVDQPRVRPGPQSRAKANAHRHDVRVDLDCLDPGPWIASRLAEYGGHVRFSGTVSPLPLYQLLHGLDLAPAERSGNPFRPEQLGVLLIGDLPTYLHSRAASLGRLVDLVEAVGASRAGHYLVAFPSFDYLRQFAEAFHRAQPERVLEIQTPGMTDGERAAFIAAFRHEGPPRLGLVVLGGVFGESVDFTGARLAGVICVGLGLPPPSLTRDAMAAHYNDRGADGRVVAYLQPALVKVVQMAGRVLRGPDDRGVLCLVDPRFADPASQAFFPSHWRPVPVRAADAGAALANFWRDEAGLPRLRASEQESPT